MTDAETLAAKPTGEIKQALKDAGVLAGKNNSTVTQRFGQPDGSILAVVCLHGGEPELRSYPDDAAAAADGEI